MRVGLTVAADSQTGCVRTVNEDSFITGQQIWAVADGMGGQAAGDQASRIAAQCIEESDQAGPLDQTGINSMMVRINQEILAYAVANPKAAGLGTTIAGVALVDVAGQNHWLVFHIGDSRVYRLTNKSLILETADHSEVQVLVETGKISPVEARAHPQRNILTRFLGIDETPKVDMRLVPYVPGERWLICSDGLTTEIEDDAIERILQETENPFEVVNTLVGVALNQGGRDNVTVVVVDTDPADMTDHTVEDTLSLSEIKGTNGSRVP